MVLTPLVRGYLRRCSENDSLLVTECLVDIGQQEFRAGIWILDTVPQDMIAVPSGEEIRMFAVESTAYPAHRDRPQVSADLRRHAASAPAWPLASCRVGSSSAGGEALYIDVPGSLILGEVSLILKAAFKGAGICYVSEWSARSHIATGELIWVLEGWGLTRFQPVPLLPEAPPHTDWPWRVHQLHPGIEQGGGRQPTSAELIPGQVKPIPWRRHRRHRSHPRRGQCHHRRGREPARR